MKFTDPDYLGYFEVSNSQNAKERMEPECLLPKEPRGRIGPPEKALRCKFQAYWQIRIGLEKKPFLKFKDKQIHAGTDTRNDYTGWNVSNYVGPKDRTMVLPDMYKPIFSYFQYKKGNVKNQKFPGRELHRPSVDSQKTNQGAQRKENQKQTYNYSPKKRVNPKIYFLLFRFNHENPEQTDERLNAAAFRLAEEQIQKQKQAEYLQKQQEIENRVATILADRKRKGNNNHLKSVDSKIEKDDFLKVADSEKFNEFEDHEAKLQRKIRRLKELKKNKKKKKKLQWMYGNLSIY